MSAPTLERCEQAIAAEMFAHTPWDDLKPHHKRRCHEAARACTGALLPVKPLAEWREDDGNCLWFEFPICEPPYVGSPLDTDWSGYHTHWMPLNGVAELAMASPPALTAVLGEKA